jgi:hypothetical protein
MLPATYPDLNTWDEVDSMRNTTRRRPSFEALEVRGLLSLSGLTWPDAGHLTLSFAPDGTSVGAPSVLSQTLGSKYPTPVWQTTILRAFQSWAALANINIGLVPDSGQPSGQPGPLQGNPGAGDVRISARPLSNDEAAVTVPFDLLGGGWSGNVTLNSNAPFGDGSGGTEDLFCVALHEAGHIFGLPDSETDPTSAMYEVDLGGRTGPSAGDAAALQALYGVRQPDAYEGAHGNDTIATATPLIDLTPGTFSSAAGLDRPIAADADVSTPTDRDVYAVTVPPGASGALTVSVRASGISLLTPRLDVLDASGRVVASAVTTDPLHNDLTVTVPGAAAGATYYARVEAGQPGVFGIGSYRIAAGMASQVGVAVALPTTPAGTTVPDGNCRLQNAATLAPVTPGTDARWSYLAHADLDAPAQAGYFRVQTGAATAPVLLATVWGDAPGGLSPRVDVLDAQGNAVPAQVVNRDAGSWTVEVTGAAPNTAYVIRVSAADPSGPHDTGSYTVAATFRPTPIALQPFACGTLSAAQPQDFRTITVASAELVHLDLSLNGGTPGDTAVDVTIYNANHQAIFTFRAVSGQGPATADVWLAPGKYDVRVAASSKSGAPLPSLFYNLSGLVRTDAIGPSPVDTTLVPVTTTGNPGNIVWTQNPLLYYAYLIAPTN